MNYYNSSIEGQNPEYLMLMAVLLGILENMVPRYNNRLEPLEREVLKHLMAEFKPYLAEVEEIKISFVAGKELQREQIIPFMLEKTIATALE